jgi:hypothetical protein
VTRTLILGQKNYSSWSMRAFHALRSAMPVNTRARGRCAIRTAEATADIERGLATFVVLTCCDGSGTEDIAMRHSAAYFNHLGSSSLGRRPVLTAIMVYTVFFGVAGSMAAFAVWRASSNCPIQRKCEHLYVVQIAAGVAGRSDPRGPPTFAS